MTYSALVFCACTAVCSGVRPFSSRALISAPASTRAFTTAGVSLNAAAQWRGVAPNLSRALRSAQASRSARTTARTSLLCAASLFCKLRSVPVLEMSNATSVGSLPSATAQWRGVAPNSSCALRSASGPMRHLTASKSPSRAATCSRVIPFSFVPSGLYMVFCLRGVLLEAATSALSCRP